MKDIMNLEMEMKCQSKSDGVDMLIDAERSKLLVVQLSARFSVDMVTKEPDLITNCKSGCV